MTTAAIATMATVDAATITRVLFPEACSRKPFEPFPGFVLYGSNSCEKQRDSRRGKGHAHGIKAAPAEGAASPRQGGRKKPASCERR